MKVLFCNRPDCFSAPGGDTVQMDETRKCLQKLGVTVDVCLETSPQCLGYDVIHIFNIQTAETGIQQMLAAASSQVPTVLSSIFWDMEAVFESDDVLAYSSGPRAGALTKVSPELARRAIEALHWFNALREGKYTHQRKMLELADAVLPNSIAESEILVSTFKLPELRKKFSVIPNGVASEWTSSNDQPSSKASALLSGLPESYVLEVARIEPIKGQRYLIEALLPHPQIPLVFVGRWEEGPYIDECMKLGRQRGNTYFTGPQARADMPHFFRRARAHALPSMRESPGLSSLEAALFGSNCVVGVHAPVLEYFGADAWVCDPTSVKDIEAQVLDAWHTERNGALGERVRTHFTWEAAAQKTLQAYELVLARRKRTRPAGKLH